MISENSKGVWVEKREYPRIKATCPVRYKINSEATWQDAILIDYSATGVCIKCDELILKGSRILVEVLPSCTKNVPPFTAEGIAVRFSLDNEHRYEIGCEFHKPIHSLINVTSN